MKLVEFLFPSSHNSSTTTPNREAIASLGNIKEFGNDRLVLETNHPVQEVESKLSKLYPSLKLVGISSTSNVKGAAVAIVGGIGTRGVVRLIEDESSVCVEGTISGLTPGKYQVSVNEYGDISNACLSTGPILSSENATDQGLLGTIDVGEGAETRFFSESRRLGIADCIGRSLVLQSVDGLQKKVACGIIGWTSGVSENNKRICACDGKVIWEEQVFGPYAVAPPTE